MRFRLYTEKTPAQALTALNERMHQKSTSTRPGLDGWIEKSGAFSISVTQPVVGKFSRTTRLTGKLVKQSGHTIIEASVSGGVEPRNRVYVYISLAVLGVTFLLTGNPLLGMALVPLGSLLYIPMKGDYDNSTLLIGEIQKTLKARATPPKAAKPVASKTPTRAASPVAAAPAGLFGARHEPEDDDDEDEEIEP